MARAQPLPARGLSGALQAPLTGLRSLVSRMTPTQLIVGGFVVLTLFGAYILTFPAASAEGTRQPFVDALFTASSGVTTTGLVVVDTGGYYSVFGQLVILVLFQIGGLGYMAFIAFLASLVGARLSYRTHLTVMESVAGAGLIEVRRLITAVFAFTFAFEGLGTVLLAFHWARQYPLPRAFYLGFFHSVSAFCTAGFGLFSDSFSAYRDSPLVNATIAVVTIAGGIGFFVLTDLREYVRRLRRRPGHRLSTHSKLALGLSMLLIAGGTAIVLLTERWPSGLSLWQRFLAASFQAISASSTTGFNTVDIGKMAQASLFTLIVLMFIGSSPGGTGGGIKTTTMGVVLASAAALLRGSQDTVIFKRRVALDTVYRAMTIGMFWTLLVTGATLLLTVTEKASFLQILFEVTSALGTVGLSMGITPELSILGKVVISIMMLLGRLGPLAVGFALLGRPRRALFRYVEAPVFVG